jgi:hypothetical protein
MQGHEMLRDVHEYKIHVYMYIYAMTRDAQRRALIQDIYIYTYM